MHSAHFSFSVCLSDCFHSVGQALEGSIQIVGSTTPHVALLPNGSGQSQRRLTCSSCSHSSVCTGAWKPSAGAHPAWSGGLPCSAPVRRSA
jgi:hypothetical protein